MLRLSNRAVKQLLGVPCSFFTLPSKNIEPKPKKLSPQGKIFPRPQPVLSSLGAVLA
jgi:hypothetical protein